MTGDEPLAQETFFLAYHLHWSRESILAMPVPERQRYVQLLRHQLEMEAQAVKRS
ncbi:MAG TPA: DUF6760 family protein [Polyangiales bacterium]|nr:DUF6760 family protein [Polyangiales bacterium]